MRQKVGVKVYYILYICPHGFVQLGFCILLYAWYFFFKWSFCYRICNIVRMSCTFLTFLFPLYYFGYLITSKQVCIEYPSTLQCLQHNFPFLVSLLSFPKPLRLFSLAIKIDVVLSLDIIIETYFCFSTCKTK